MDPLGDPLEAGQVGVVRRGLAADLEAAVEAARVPVEAEVPVQLLDEEVELLRLRHLDLRMQAEVVVDARRAALEAADDDQVRQLARAVCGGAGSGSCDRPRSARGHARTSPRRRDRGRRLGWHVRVGVRHERASVAAMPIADLRIQLRARSSNSAAEFFRHLSEIDWTSFGVSPALPAGDAAGPRLGLAQRPARRLSRAAHLLPAAQRRLPGRGRDQRDHPGPRRRRHQSLPRQAPDPRLLLPGGHLLLPRPDRLRHHRRGARPRSTRSPRGCCRRCRRSPTCPPSRSPSGSNTRSVFFIALGVLLLATRDRHLPLAHRVRRFWARVRPGRRHPRRAAPLPARGRRLAGGRLAAAASPPSGSSSTPSGSAARSATCCW